MTIKLYDLNAYQTEFDAVVTACIQENDKFIIVLDQTLFFPEEGGQSCDKGTLNGHAVTEVKIKNNIIYHYTDSEIKAGTLVHGVIDFDHRFRNMQMHSGEHIFTGLIHNRLGLNNVGFHLSDNSATMDYDGKIDETTLFEIEKEANKIIFSNVAIKAYYPDHDELYSLDYRSKKEIDGAVRIVIVEGIDICACCAPHVQRTGEIGIFKITGFENYKGGVRVHYLCGYRALEHYSNRINELKAISTLLTVKENTEALSVTKLYDENRNLKFELVGAKQELLKQRILKTIISDSKYAVFVGSEEDTPLIKYAMEVLHSQHSGICAAFTGNEESGYRYMIEENNGDVSFVNSVLKEKYNAKGGGRKESVQGTVYIKEQDIYLLFD